MRPALRTVWRIRTVAVPGESYHAGLDVQLVVDTTAPAVVDAIERAARDHGIALERVDEPEPEPEQ